MKLRINATQEKVDQGLKQITEKGGEINESNFDIMGVSGYFGFRPQDNILIVVVTKKPVLASWVYIEKKIKEFFEN